MSAFASASPGADCQGHQSSYQPLFPYPGHVAEPPIATSASGEEMFSMESQPFLKTPRSYRCRSGPSSSLSRHHESSINLLAQPMTTDRNSLALLSQTKVEALHSNYPNFTAAGASGAGSAMPRLLPGPAEAEQDEQAEWEEEMTQSRAELEGIADGASTKTAWEGRVDKRKTNRFR